MRKVCVCVGDLVRINEMGDHKRFPPYGPWLKRDMLALICDDVYDGVFEIYVADLSAKGRCHCHHFEGIE